MTNERRDVERMLGGYSRGVWEVWARARGLDPGKLYGPALPKELARLLLAPAALKAALAETTPEERTVLARLKQYGGKVPAPELKAQLLIDGVPDPEAAFAALMSRGLLFYDRAMEGYYSRWELWGSSKEQSPYTPALWLPSEVSERVTVPDDLGRLPLEAAPEPARFREGSFAGLQRDLYLLLQALRESPAKLLKAGGVSKRDSERLLKILPTTGIGENDPTAQARAEGAWFHFLWFLVQQAELLQEQPGQMTVSPAGLQFLSRDAAQQASLLMRAWTQLPSWNEFRRVPTLQFEDTPYGDIAFDSLSGLEFAFVGGGFNDVPTPQQLIPARRMLLELLQREQPYPEWHSFASLLASVKRLRISFLIPRSETRGFGSWGRQTREEGRYHGFHARGSSPPRCFHKERDWDRVEGAFLRTLLEEPLLWLGLVRLGYEGDALISFQLTERGAVALGLAEAPAAPARKQPPPDAPAQRALVVQPNFEVVVYPEIAGIPLLVELDRFAQRVRMDRAALYRLTRADLCRGLQDGLTLSRITETLEAANAGPLPQNVTYSLAEWESLFNRIQVRRSVTLIEAADDAELQSLRALPELADAREIAPRVLLAPPRLGLRRLPGEPLVIDYQAPIAHALEFETATRVRVLPDALTPRLRHRLLQIADPFDEADHGDTEDTEGAQRGTAGRKGGVSAQASRAAGRPVSSASSSNTSVPPPCPPCLRGESLRFELSREKISQAARWWRWEAIESFLAGAARAQPPPDLTVMLRGWAGGLPAAAVTTVTLFAAPSAEWLDLVMQAPEVRRRVLHRLSPTIALVTEEDRPHLEAALAALGVPLDTAGSLGRIMEGAAQAEADAGETLLIGPPRKRRALLEQAIAQKRRVVIAEMSYSGKLTTVKADPLRLEGEGAGAALIARVEGFRHDYRYPLNRIQGVRMLDEPIKP